MLEAHLNAIEQVLIAQSNAAQNAGNPNLRGGPREWFIHEFLESHLPSIYEIGQGEIIDENSTPEPPKGNYRSQVDLIIYRRDIPKIKYSRIDAAYFSQGVKATIESKSVLSRSDVEQSCMASKSHKSLVRAFKSTPQQPEYIISYVVAYDGPQKISTVANWLPDITRQLKAKPEELVEMIIVLGKGIIWRIDACPDFPIPSVPPNRKWAFMEQKGNNLYALFTHMLSWVSNVSPQPDTSGYASYFYFNNVETV